MNAWKVDVNYLSRKSKKNIISTRKYNIYNFAPKFLIEQFSRPSNLIFLLLVIINFIPGLGVIAPVTSLLPLGFILGISLLKDIITEIRHLKNDQEVNNIVLSEIIRFGEIKRNVKSKDIRQGDILHLNAMEQAPCDVLVLSLLSDNPLYISVSGLTGEKGLKAVNPLFSRSSSDMEVWKTCFGRIYTEKCNGNLKSFDGKVYLHSLPHGVTSLATRDFSDFEYSKAGASVVAIASADSCFLDEQLRDRTRRNSITHITDATMTSTIADAHSFSLSNTIYRGSKLTNSCVAVAVYTGKHCKTMMGGKRKTKVSKKQAYIDLIIIIQLVILLLAVITNSAIMATHVASFQSLYPYAGFDSMSDSQIGVFFQTVGSSIVLLSYAIPMVLFVSIEFVRFFNGMYILSDLALSNGILLAAANNDHVIEDLGRVDIIFSDKTGTLTKNELVLQGLEKCQPPNSQTEQGKTEPNDAECILAALCTSVIPCYNGLDNVSMRHIRDEFYSRVVCNTGSTGIDELLASLTYTGSSVDEICVLEYLRKQRSIALVYRDSKYSLLCAKSRHTNIMQLRAFELLNEKPFSSSTKVMLCIYREIDLQRILEPPQDSQIEGKVPYNHTLSNWKAMTQATESDTNTSYGLCDSSFLWTPFSCVLSEGVSRQAPIKCTSFFNGRLFMVLKGAPSRVIKMLDRSKDYGDESGDVGSIERMVNEGENKGLRLMLWGYKELQLKNLQHPDAIQTLSDVHHDESQVQRSILENVRSEDLKLLCMSKIDDSLADDAVATLARMRKAKIEFVICTGDSVGAGITIAQRLNLFPKGSNKLFNVLSVLTQTHSEFRGNLSFYENNVLIFAAGEGLRDEDMMNNIGTLSDLLLYVLSAEVEGYTISCAVDGSFLDLFSELTSPNTTIDKYLNDNPATKMLFERIISLMNRQKRFVCCAMTPGNKAAIVALWQFYNAQRVSLAIGDGQNDIGMLQKAGVGVGLLGKEGTYAASNGDIALFSINQLPRLLFVHGHYAEYRTNEVIMYNIYKNTMLAIVCGLFNFENLASSQLVVNDFLSLMYNVVLNFLPIFLFSICEKDIKDRYLESMPSLYPEFKMRNRPTIFWILYIFNYVNSLYSALVLYYSSCFIYGDSALWSDGASGDMRFLGFLIINTITYVTLLKIVLRSKSFSSLFIAGCIFSLVLYYTTVLIINYTNTFTSQFFNVLTHSVASLSFWVGSIAIVVAVLLPSQVFRLIMNFFVYQNHSMEISQYFRAVNGNRRRQDIVMRHKEERCLAEVLKRIGESAPREVPTRRIVEERPCRAD